MASPSLRTRLRSVRRRLLVIGSAGGAAWGLALAVVLLLAGAWLDLLWEFSPPWRIATLVAAAAVGAMLLGALIRITAQAGRDVPIARRLDRAAGSGGDVLTRLDLDEPFSLKRPTAARHPELTAGLARLAVDRAASVAARVPSAAAVPARPLGRSLGTLVLLLAGVALLTLCLPGLARTQWNRFTDPYGDVPPFSQTHFEVSPKGAEVLYGDPLEIHCVTSGAAVDQLQLVLQHDTGQQETLPMFPEPDGHWRAALAKVLRPAVYYVRGNRARSERYHLDVITVPRIESVRVRITPPAYTNEAYYEGPLPKDGLAGLPGTEVRIWAQSNRPLSGGTVTVTGPQDSTDVTMRPTAGDNREVVGQFEISADGKFQLTVTDAAGQASREVFSGGITLLADQRPFVRLLQPRKTSLATPSAVLPVVLSGEDDYGISRVQLYRSLNDSRPLPADVAVAEPPPRKVYEQAYLPLAAYGLEPGDEIKLFGRVEDNDPAGAKGSESSVATVRIISQEEFERMLQVREGIEVLMSKYAEARRRMEGLAKDVRGLQKKLDGQSPEGPVNPENREEMRRMVERLRKESAELRKSARHKLPLDIDKNLTPQLEQLASISSAVAAELEKLLADSELLNERLAKKLEEMNKKLGAGREQFEQMATLPLEQLAAVFPLIADQSRFVMLALHQQDLAERLAALEGRDGEDNPALKTRMRDLEEEQRQLREQLGELLDDIEDHIQQVPDEPEFDKLRETARKFVDDLRQSGAAEAMAAAEAGLAEFSGTRGHQKAQQAADILEKFLKQCQGGGMAECAGGCLIFQPKLGGCLGNTVAQLLAQMGMPGTGSGSGTGSGAGSGYSARRSAMPNMGLYGGMPGMGEAYGEAAGSEGSRADSSGDHRRGGANPDAPTLIELPAEAAAAGISEGAVPVRYRRQVGQYFQRIAEEREVRYPCIALRSPTAGATRCHYPAWAPGVNHHRKAWI